ncbi:hypothetical protein [Spiroplasma ixodetis]|uniref:Uncharacterized protein n=1 Tax=Spiroplasma ixodetis TaxID=2141 RepID=A0ABM8JQ85_9MOLU
MKNRNTNNVKFSEESLKVDEINKEAQKLFLKSDDEKIKPIILK